MSAGYSLSGVSVHLGSRRVLEELDLTLEPGLFTVVIGPNGAGKTTLLRALAALVQPAAGDIVLGGRSLPSLTRFERARAIAYLPQGGSVAWPIPVAAVAALGRFAHGERPEALPERGRAAVREALRAVGLIGFEHRLATELSGGERARMLLARALATEAPALLADEPVAALDPRHQLIVLDVLRAHARAGAVVVAVMHDLSLAARFADRIVLIDRGRVAAAGQPEAVLTAPHLSGSFGIEAEVIVRERGFAVLPTRPLTVDEPPP